MKKLTDSLVIVAVILAIWQGLFAYAGDVAITSPLRTFAFAAELLTHAPFWDHAAATLLAFAYALAISAAAGIALGLLLGLRRFAGDVAEPVLVSLYTIPKVTLYPVMLLSSAITAMQSTLAALQPGSQSPQPPAISFTDLQSVVGFPDYWSRETRYQAKEKA